MSEYSIALERQLALARYAETVHWPEMDEGQHACIRAAKDALALGDTYYVSDAMSELVFTAAGDPGIFPFVLQRDDLPGFAGFVHLQSEWGMRSLDASRLPFRDDEWIWIANDTGVLLAAIVMNPDPEACSNSSTGFDFFSWPFGISVGEAIAQYTDSPVIGEMLVRNTAALVAFMRQRLLVTEHSRVDRATRRRIGPVRSDIVSVVLLRRTTSQGSADVSNGGPDWSCRWFVRGHWRSQWYPKLRRHQPKYVMPYLKGPEDRPLKASRSTIFAVVR